MCGRERAPEFGKIHGWGNWKFFHYIYKPHCDDFEEFCYLLKWFRSFPSEILYLPLHMLIYVAWGNSRQS